MENGTVVETKLDEKSVFTERYNKNNDIEKFSIPALREGSIYDFNLKSLLKSDIVYFNPMMSEALVNNPFKSADRQYPVEMPSKMDEIYVLSMDIPKGYLVDELPKSARVVYNGDDGMFEYIIQKNADNIQMHVHLKMNRTFFPMEEYSTLRNFFSYVVKKENEQIVFKKIP